MGTTTLEYHFLRTFWEAAGGQAALAECVDFVGTGDLRSAFAVTAFSAGAMGAAGLALARLRRSCLTGQDEDVRVTVDRRLASLWFGTSIHPVGWALPPLRDSVIGDYAASDGWIRIHTNAPHHLRAALSTLGVAADPHAVASAISRWRADDLESAIVANGGCAATMRSWSAWQTHAQGHAVLSEPLVHWSPEPATAPPNFQGEPTRPLQGVRVLDMTRVLAGPACTRMLAGAGAEVLRIDPPWWDEPGLAPEMTLGKRCARLDLRDDKDRDIWVELLRLADILVHGYRSDALESIGLGAEARQAIRPGLVDVSLDAYGHTGPWRCRRGFDSLVQMSMGIAHAGMQRARATRPVPLPVQALDHATGYLLATAALRGMEERLRSGHGCVARVSLARTGAELMRTLDHPDYVPHPLPAASDSDFEPTREPTHWGPALRLRWPVMIPGVRMRWTTPSGPLGKAVPSWI